MRIGMKTLTESVKATKVIIQATMSSCCCHKINVNTAKERTFLEFQSLVLFRIISNIILNLYNNKV